jgi:hypothetical protein
MPRRYKSVRFKCNGIPVRIGVQDKNRKLLY